MGLIMSIAFCQMLPRDFTDTSMKTILGDDILSKGSLVLLDPTHPLRQWEVGVPLSGTRLPNLADITASRLVQGEFRPTFKIENSMVDGSFIERTQKGGLHAGISSGQTRFSGTNIVIPDPILAYMLANQTHEFYFSIWSYVTQPTEGVSTAESQMHIYRGLNNPYPRGGVVTLPAQGSWSRPTGPNQTGRFVNNPNTVGPRFNNIAGFISGSKNEAGDLLTMSDFALSQQKNLVSMGPANTESLYTATNAGGKRLQSWSMYRVYIEDLTVSQRSYASVHAIDIALYNKEMVIDGGRYKNDSWRADPA